MATDWRQFSREAGLKVQDDAILVSFGDGRTHQVYASEPSADGQAMRLWAVAARPAALGEHPNQLAWERNRTSDIVGFKIDRRGRLIGEAWVPLAGLDAAEWGVYVRTVARSCDRLEYLLTGRDEH